jgi:tetratricopeptide (TPR) repeat protein
MATSSPIPTRGWLLAINPKMTRRRSIALVVSEPDRQPSAAIAIARAATDAAARHAADAAGWTTAVEAWDAVMDDLEVTGDSVSYAINLDYVARTRLFRAWAGGPSSDLDVAARLWRRAVAVETLKSGDRGPIVNNLGVVLRELWERDHDPAVLDEAITVAEQAVAASAPSTAKGVGVCVQLARSLRERFAYSRCRRDIDAAVEALANALYGVKDMTADDLASWHEQLGNALDDRYWLLAEPADLEAAVVHLREAAELDGGDMTDVRRRQTNLGTVLLVRFELYGASADVDEATELLESAFVSAGGPDGASGQLLVGLGNAWRLRSIRDGSVSDVDRAIELLNSVRSDDRPGLRMEVLLNYLAAGYLQRYDLTGRLADLDAAIDLLEESVAVTLPGDGHLGVRLSNLGGALRTRQLRRRRGRRDLDRAVAVFERALEASGEHAPESAAARGNLGNALKQRYDLTNDVVDLDRAVAEFETALKRISERSPDRPRYLNSLAAALSTRASRPDGALADLTRAVALSGEAVRLSEASPSQRSTCLVNFAHALSERYTRLHDPADLSGARDAYRAAIRAGLLTRAADALGAALNWSQWARHRGDWHDVAEAYENGEQASRRLVATQLRRADKEAWIRDAEGLTINGAYALVATSEFTKAVTALERGRALLLSEALEREDVDLSMLEASHPTLVERFRATAWRLRQLERVE